MISENGELGLGTSIYNNLGDEYGEMGDYLPYIQFTNVTYSPTLFPTKEPTSDPTDDPTTDPTKDPTLVPTTDPTTDPTKDPTSDPTIEPTNAPTATPTPGPTASPTEDPTKNPTLDPTADPTNGPTLEPTQSPSAAPLELAVILEQNAKSANELSFVADISLYIIGAGGVCVVLIAFLYMESGEKSNKRMVVDDQGYVGAISYLIQIVDIFSDFVFALQCRSYWEYGLGDDDVDEEVFWWMYHVALLFVGLPYLMNLYSSINITRKLWHNLYFQMLTT